MAKRRREKMSEGKKNIIAIQEYDIKIIIVLIMVMLTACNYDSKETPNA